MGLGGYGQLFCLVVLRVASEPILCCALPLQGARPAGPVLARRWWLWWAQGLAEGRPRTFGYDCVPPAELAEVVMVNVLRLRQGFSCQASC